MGSFVMGGPPKPKTVVIPGQKYPEACVWQPTSNLLVLFKFFVGYSFLVSRPFAHIYYISKFSRKAAPVVLAISGTYIYICMLPVVRY